MSDVIAAVATGKIPCAIGILRLSGDGCAEIADKVFTLQSGCRFSDAPNRKLLMGTLHDRRGRVIDQALAVYTRAPNTYTGEDTLELQCHGSPAVLAAGLEALFAAGARQAGPGEFTKRAFLNGRMDLIQAEAVIDLIDAESADAAANAAGQVGGALVGRLEPIYQALVDICSHYHAVLDYPDEDIAPFQMQSFTQMLLDAHRELSAMLATCAAGQYLKHGVRTVLLGKPNVGKSSLLNALAGFERVIVTPIAGTTRDAVEQTVNVGGTLFRLLDTAGIRDARDEIEQLGVARSRDAVGQADLCLLVCDASAPPDEQDRQAVEAARSAPNVICVCNKSDLGTDYIPSGFAQTVCVSAKTGAGLDALRAAMRAPFVSGVPCDGSILTNARQTDAVTRAAAAIASALDAMRAQLTPDAVLLDVEQAMQAMGELTGKTVREDITQRIFERFCVGK